MAVNLQAPNELLPVPGIKIGTACAAIKQRERHDVALFSFAPGTETGGVYTQSHFAAAPVFLARERDANSHGWVINSGNANAATGAPGLTDADGVCRRAAQYLQVDERSIQPFSTGVIGERLPVGQIEQALEECYLALDENAWLAAAQAIMTTDTVPKGLSKQIQLDGATVTITGIAKGAGMIKPNMATMLAYIGCDAHVGPGVAKMLVRDAVDHSFNRITVDGDTSTNDCFMLACSGVAGHSVIAGREDTRYAALLAAIIEVARWLAQAIVRDGEGATKFVSVTVAGGSTEADCLAVAYTIAESPLVKTALFAGDANWGRFCMAIGRAPVQGLQADRVALWLDDVQVASGGLMCDSYTDGAGTKVLAQDEFTVRVDLGLGPEQATIWTTDLSYEYIRINAEYRT